MTAVVLCGVSCLKARVKLLLGSKSSKAMVANQHGRGIKVLRTDQVGEFTSKEFNEFYEYEGITRQLTTPYTPQHNGIIERRNQTILNLTRSILKAMNMPQSFWVEAIRHLIFLLDRLPIKFMKNQTSYEVLKGKRPNLEHLRVFGCIGHVKIPTIHTKKLDNRSEKMIHLGAEEGSKAYRMFDVNSGRIILSRDVKFQETQGWDWKSNGKEEGKDEVEFSIQVPVEVHFKEEAGMKVWDQAMKEEIESIKKTEPGS
ncbi:hypothetical protein E3N88_44807 [Mikania micrantha]|uniref:Integrase catalytic domain-containing protein n=1 Tax=Mikania micrantha TaxID=192012 RepID=A0A5N6LB76_9ASTR|nr:hypothetical protein E3N88_44807 [Mikania micrantha]